MDGPAGDCDGEGQEKSIDRLIEAELEELGDKNKVHLLDLFALPIFDATVKMIFLTVSLLLLFICLYSYSSSSYTAHSSWHSCPLISSSLWSFIFFCISECMLLVLSLQRCFLKLDSGCNGVVFVQMRKKHGGPGPKDIAQHLVTSAASTSKHMSRCALITLPPNPKHTRTRRVMSCKIYP